MGQTSPKLTRLLQEQLPPSTFDCGGIAMRFGLVALAAAALGFAMPANAAIWFLDVSAYGPLNTTTKTYNCTPGLPIVPGQCPVTTVTDNPFSITRQILVSPFSGPIQFNEQIGFQTFITGTIDFTNGEFRGSGFRYSSYFENCRIFHYGCFEVYSELTAPVFTVSFVRSVDGPAPVPEPAAWLMMFAGFGLVGAAMRLRCGTVKLV